MTAGKGVQHAEMFPLLDKESANTLELFQIWLNLPASRKFADPSYIMFWNGDTPISDIRDANGKITSVTIIAGKLNESQAPAPPPDSWAAEATNSVAIWSLKMEPGAHWTLPAAEPGLNRTLYFFRGDALQVAGKEIKPYHSVRLRSDLPALIECADGSCELLLLQGRPIGEAVVQYGPFVMNTRAEIEEAFSDYRRTSFGGWPWPTDDPVHGSEKTRFARFADGKTEKPED
jgi:redox-sensitive bicupin YhaK (pirin superfamily)